MNHLIPGKDNWTTFEKDLRVLKWRDCIVTFKYGEDEDGPRRKQKKWSYRIEDLVGIHEDEERYRDDTSWNSVFDSALYEVEQIVQCRYGYGGQPVVQVFPIPDGLPPFFQDHNDVEIKPVSIL